MRRTLIGLAVGALVLVGCGGSSDKKAAPAPTVTVTHPAPSPTSTSYAADVQSWSRMFESSTSAEIASRCADVKTQAADAYAAGLLAAESKPTDVPQATQAQLSVALTATVPSTLSSPSRSQ